MRNTGSTPLKQHIYFYVTNWRSPRTYSFRTLLHIKDKQNWWK